MQLERMQQLAGLPVLSEGKQTFYHWTIKKLPVGKVLTAKRTKRPYFDDYEYLIEKYKPSSAISRLECFYLTDDQSLRTRMDIGATGKILAVVEPVGQVIKCDLTWIQALLDMPEIKTKYIRGDYNRIVGIEDGTEDTIRSYVNGYYSSKPANGLGYRRHTWEWLAQKITVISQEEVL